tara:strand:- start:145 stop:375 length:231 start_codon:yes stop_codon:yes gene_type:complete
MFSDQCITLDPAQQYIQLFFSPLGPQGEREMKLFWNNVAEYPTAVTAVHNALLRAETDKTRVKLALKCFDRNVGVR